MTNETLELRFANRLTSLMAVMVPMLINIIGLSIASAHLLYKIFPKEDMSDQARIVAAIAIGAGIALALVSATVNKKLLKSWLPVILAIISGYLLLFFFQVFELYDTRSWHESLSRISVSGVLAFLEYLFADMFVKKLQEVRQDVKLETKIVKLQATNKELTATISQLNTSIDQLKPTESQLKRLTSEYKKLAHDLTCRKCGQRKNARSLASHESTCKGS